MENLKIIKGIFPALVTPFKTDGRLDYETFETLIDRIYNAGVHGLFVGGNMGEWYTQTLEERKRIAEEAVIHSKGRGEVILHVGCTRMEDAVELAKFGEKLDVRAIASLPPYHVRLSEKDLISYYRNLSEVTSLPLFIYYHPALTGYQLSPGLFQMVESTPNIAGIKYTDYDLLNLTNLIELREKGLSIMDGHDQILFPSLLLGASGGIGSFYNIIPKAFVKLYKSMIEGDMDFARDLQKQINEFIGVIKRSALIPSFKYILHLNGIGSEYFRVSMQSLSEDEKSTLRKYITENSFFNKWTI
jgi:N-acetylneuraminate lyase